MIQSPGGKERRGSEERERPFPLVFWQETPGFLAEEEAARQRLAQISQKWYKRGSPCGFLGSLGCHKDGDFMVWLNDSRPCQSEARLNPRSAFQLAKQYGSTGWWNLDDLAELIEGRGIVIEEAMKDIGFRPHKKIPGQWVRVRSGEKFQTSGHRENPFVPVEDEEGQRLQALLVMPNDHEYAPGKIFYLEVGKRGLIYVSLWVDPFAGLTAETIGQLVEQSGHINREQRGFTIKARNISLGGEDVIHILAEAPDKNRVETVWPSQTDESGLLHLATDLNNKVQTASPQPRVAR